MWVLVPKSQAQEKMFVTLQNGTILQFPIEEIESLTFDIQTNLMQQNEILAKFLEAKAYPNPASELVNISYKLGGEGKVFLEIFSSYGSKINEFSPGFLPPGEYNYQWNTEENPPGMYILRILQNNALVTEKIIINR